MLVPSRICASGPFEGSVGEMLRLSCNIAIQACMAEPLRDELLRLFRLTLNQCREANEFWVANDFRLRIGGIDITEAERAASVQRIQHLENLIAAMEQEDADS